jgi:ribosomal-protein-alanine N-acetyltransferase
MRGAMRLVFTHAFDELGLHRLQANVQPGNERSRRLLQATGWREEGFAPRYLFIDGDWRDHVLYAITAEEISRPA